MTSSSVGATHFKSLVVVVVLDVSPMHNAFYFELAKCTTAVFDYGYEAGQVITLTT